MKPILKYLLSLCFVFASLSLSFAQDRYLQGTVKDSKNSPLIGASVLIKGTQIGTATDTIGAFTLPLKNEESLTLVITSVGYLKQEVIISKNRTANVFIVLEEEIKNLDELIVTGVFDSRKRIESSIAITTIDSKVLDRIVPNSAIELLRQVPGVFVNTSRGEIYNEVITRGMVLGGGYYYVSMQEDGLPIIPAAGQFDPSGYLRADVSVERLEAVRGGTASILGVNAPGGIYNYISKTGTSTFQGEVRTRFGLEGNGKNPYYRAETGFGGPLGKKENNLTYYIGGHYRHADGAKYPGYPLSRGGQVKGNVKKTYKNGYFQLNFKYLHDRTVQFEFTPTVNFDNPTPAGNFTNSSSVLNPAVTLQYPASILGLTDVSYDSRNLNLYKDLSLGFNWEHRFEKGWKVQNAFRYSNKSVLSNASFIVYPFAVDKPLFYIINGLFGKFGTYHFYNPKTKQSYGTVSQELDFSDPNDPLKFTSKLNLPGSEVQPNSVFYNPLSYEKGSLKDIVNQFTVKKQFTNMGFTAGLFHSTTQFQDYLTPPAATGYGTIEDKPQFVAIDYIPSDVANPPTYHFTDPKGISGYGGGGLRYTESIIKQTALFFGHNWDITDKLNLDWGIRFEDFNIEGKRRNSAGQNTVLGDIDKNPTTLYDNDSYVISDFKSYKSHLNTFAFSGGVNYRINNDMAFYARYSQGSKAPDFSFYDENSKVIKIEGQRTVQIELGVKVSKGKSNLFVTPFYSALDKVPNLQYGQNDGRPATFYALPKIYNKTHAIGIEIEGNYALNEKWSIKANAMVQQFTADKYQFYDFGLYNGPDDDTLIDRSGKKISSYAPSVIFNITPTFSHKSLYANVNWYYMGKRAANTSETFYLPAFSQFDFNIGFSVSKKIQLQGSINNVLNKFGIMNWTAPTPGGLPFETFNTEALTPEKRAANPNAVYFTSGIQPRAYFVSCAFKF